MPPRSSSTLLLVAIVSLLCYSAHRRTRDALVVGDALRLIHRSYLDPVDDRKLLIDALAGMTAGLDPYSEFIPLDQYDQLKSAMAGEFAGIGIYVDRPDDTKPVRVITPLIGSPALAAGLLAGDGFLEIDGEDVADMELTEISGRLKGPIGTIVHLVVDRDGERVSLTVRRDNIRMESVVGDYRGDNDQWQYTLQDAPSIGYARLSTFGERTPVELREVLESLPTDTRGFVLDLRGNGGGLLETAVAICDLFLTGGIVVSTEVRGGVIESQYTVGQNTALPMSTPMVVLIDHNSASASEIVAAALQDRGRATIVGTRSFGKGSVQNVIPLESGRSALKLTVARYLRPSKVNIHRGKDDGDDAVWGVSPTQENVVEISDEQIMDLFIQWRNRAYPGAAEAVVPTPETVPQETPSETSDAPEPSDASSPPGEIDPQLRRAVEVLTTAMEPKHSADFRRPRNSRPATQMFADSAGNRSARPPQTGVFH